MGLLEGLIINQWVAPLRRGSGGAGAAKRAQFEGGCDQNKTGEHGGAKNKGQVMPDKQGMFAIKEGKSGSRVKHLWAMGLS